MSVPDLAAALQRGCLKCRTARCRGGNRAYAEERRDQILQAGSIATFGYLSGGLQPRRSRARPSSAANPL